jgi:hypothetical protein
MSPPFSGETGIPSSQLLRLAAHLAHWGLAMLLTTVTSHAVYMVCVRCVCVCVCARARARVCTYACVCSAAGAAPVLAPRHKLLLCLQVHPQADPLVSSPLAAEFELAFPVSDNACGDQLQGRELTAELPTSLSAALALFSSRVSTDAMHTPLPSGAPYASEEDEGEGGGSERYFALPTGSGRPWRTLVAGMAPAAVDRFTRMLAWLLKHGLLVQMHVYVYLLWPWPLRSGAGGDDWLPAELDFLQACGDGQPEHVAILLRRLVAYLREVTTFAAGAALPIDSAASEPVQKGVTPLLQLHLRLDDIIWRLHTTRHEVLAVLRSFPELFVVSIHA